MAAAEQLLERRLPDWVPEAARNYLVHTEAGLSIRALARANDCHASTILRQVRRYENRRDDPLVDDALRTLSRRLRDAAQSEGNAMHIKIENAGQTGPLTEARIMQEGQRLLRRLAEAGAVMAVARDMEMAVVVRDNGEGGSTRTAVTSREMAQAMALREWITCADPQARIAKYTISASGRNALKSMMSDLDDDFGMQRRDMVDRDIDDNGTIRHLRSNMLESPLTGLARRRDKDGQPFLTRDLVAAGERLREDFELANMGPKTTTDWDKFLTGPTRGTGAGMNGGSESAKGRVAAALSDLGPGLGDVVLRCCCFLEGLEAAEKKMGWAARSGKIVLRIALQRLKRHYEEQGQYAPKIG